MSLRSTGILVLAIFVFASLASCGHETIQRDSGNVGSVSLSDDSHVVRKQIDTGKIILEKFNAIMSVQPNAALKVGGEKLGLSQNEAGRLILCDGGLGWRAIDPKNLKELWIDKEDEMVFAPPIDLHKNVEGRAKGPVDEIQAVKIAQQYFVRYGRQVLNTDEGILTSYFPSVCDIGDSWRIYFISYQLQTIKERSDLRKLANDHPPNYLVDKNTGEITYSSQSQHD